MPNPEGSGTLVYTLYARLSTQKCKAKFDHSAQREREREATHLIEGLETATAPGEARLSTVALQTTPAISGGDPETRRCVRHEPSGARETPESDAAVAVGGVARGVGARERHPAVPHCALHAGGTRLGVVWKSREIVAGGGQRAGGDGARRVGGVEPGGEGGAAAGSGGEAEVASGSGGGGACGGDGREKVGGKVERAGGRGDVGLFGEGRDGGGGKRGGDRRRRGRVNLDGGGVGDGQRVQHRDSE